MLAGGGFLAKGSFPRLCFSLGTLALVWMQLPRSQAPSGTGDPEGAVAPGTRSVPESSLHPEWCELPRTLAALTASTERSLVRSMEGKLTGPCRWGLFRSIRGSRPLLILPG